MASTSPKISAEIFKDRRVQIGAAVVVLLIIAATLFVTLGGGTGDRGSVSADPSTTPGGADAGAVPAPPFPGATVISPTGSPTPPVPGPGGNSNATSARQTASADTNSFAGAPPGMQLGPGGGGVSAPAPGGPFGPGGTEGGLAAAAPTTSKPAPIKAGVPAQKPRPDPFISFFREVTPQPPAYLYAQPLRVASYPKPRAVPTSDPIRDLGPLPFVERRVAGILYNGTVSAILETGPSGPGGQVDVVQPGSKVMSGIAGVADLTVESIGPTEVTLRSEDNRRVQVKLTGLPEGARPNNPAGGPGAGDFPGGGGNPGGFRGGGGGGGRPGVGTE